MPINLFNNPLSSIKLGADDILKGYIGNDQIFPNNTEITAAAFTDANIANTGGNTPYVVSGEVGASFSLTGSAGATAPSGTQVISSSPSTYQIAIASNQGCGDPQRNSQVVITPQGNTVLASGLSNTDTITQAAGPPTIANNIGLTITVTNTSYQTITVGGQVRWAPGAQWSVTIGYTVGAGGNTGISTMRINGPNAYMTSGLNPNGVGWTNTNSGTQPSNGSYWSNPDNLGGSLGSGSYNTNFMLTQALYPQGLAAVSFSGTVGNSGCNVASPSSISSAAFYP
jgi:hypothetical protein